MIKNNDTAIPLDSMSGRTKTDSGTITMKKSKPCRNMIQTDAMPRKEVNERISPPSDLLSKLFISMLIQFDDNLCKNVGYAHMLRQIRLTYQHPLPVSFSYGMNLVEVVNYHL